MARVDLQPSADGLAISYTQWKAWLALYQSGHASVFHRVPGGPFQLDASATAALGPLIGNGLLGAQLRLGQTADGKAFSDTYKAMYKKEPDYLGQFGYVQSMLLFEAIERAADKGTLKKGGVADELRKTDRETLIGRVQFGANGDNPNFVHRMGQHQDKKIVIVWPKETATGKIAYPALPW